MGRRRTSRRLDPSVAPQLKVQLERGHDLLARAELTKHDYDAWDQATTTWLVQAFGAGSEQTESVTTLGKFDGLPPRSDSKGRARHRRETLQQQLQRLLHLTELLQAESPSLKAARKARSKGAARGEGVFLVHGHNHAVLHDAARKLEQLGASVVILHEQANRGQTVIEKLEANSTVGFAVVFLTADDEGGVRTAKTKTKALQPRARQNVILELGYFLARLGRERVVAIHESGVELPSDYLGVLYIEIDKAGAWKHELVRELRAAGCPLDLNRDLATKPLG
jgi:predicted nucleotide-binding protein